MDIECERCRRTFKRAATGRPRRFCSTRCRVAAHRASPFPRAMTSRSTWTRSAARRPITPEGRPASSTDRTTWGTFASVQSGAGDGFGIMLGDGLGCYDLDDVTDEQARDFIATVSEPIVYVERSMSGNGVHVFVEAPEARGWKRNIRGVSVERYSRARFIRVTGMTFST